MSPALGGGASAAAARSARAPSARPPRPSGESHSCDPSHWHEPSADSPADVLKHSQCQTSPSQPAVAWTLSKRTPPVAPPSTAFHASCRTPRQPPVFWHRTALRLVPQHCAVFSGSPPAGWLGPSPAPPDDTGGHGASVGRQGRRVHVVHG